MTGGGPENRPAAWTESQVREELAPELEVVRLLGKGSMASVFLARDTALKRLVARYRAQVPDYDALAEKFKLKKSGRAAAATK